MILSHYRAGSKAVLIETREERRAIGEILAELPPSAIVGTCAAPGGPVRDAKTGAALKNAGNGLQALYSWLAAGSGRVGIVFDGHMLINNPGFWRSLIENMPAIGSPKWVCSCDHENSGEKKTCERCRKQNNSPASLAVFIGPTWELSAQNPLRGSMPIIPHAPPGRAALAAIAAELAPTNGSSDDVADALCGLPADAAEQAAAECLAANAGKWNTDYLRGARRQAIRESGLEIWSAVETVGGLSGIKTFADAEVFPWIRDPLSVRRLLLAGLPGTGKSYISRWFAHRLKCECVRLSVPAMKAGLVGQSEANLRRALRTIDALAAEAPLVVVFDEIDTIAREGLDGGTSSGMFSELLTWFQESQSLAVAIATLNRLDKLDAALDSRFTAQFFFELPTKAERESVALIHFRNMKCDNAEESAATVAQLTDGFSSRELAEKVCPSAARLSNRKPTAAIIREVTSAITPTSRTQTTQLQQMRAAASTLRRANDPAEDETATAARGRRVSH